VSLVGGADETRTLSSRGFPLSLSHASLRTVVTVVYHIVHRYSGGVIVFVTDDWVLTDNMCLTVRHRGQLYIVVVIKVEVKSCFGKPPYRGRNCVYTGTKFNHVISP